MTNKSIAAFLILTGTIFISAVSYAEVKLPAIFGDHMVLQQKENVTIWGWAEPGEEVTVKGSWQRFKKATIADENGKSESGPAKPAGRTPLRSTALMKSFWMTSLSARCGSGPANQIWRCRWRRYPKLILASRMPRKRSPTRIILTFACSKWETSAARNRLTMLKQGSACMAFHGQPANGRLALPKRFRYFRRPLTSLPVSCIKNLGYLSGSLKHRGVGPQPRHGLQLQCLRRWDCRTN